MLGASSGLVGWGQVTGVRNIAALAALMVAVGIVAGSGGGWGSSALASTTGARVSDGQHTDARSAPRTPGDQLPHGGDIEPDGVSSAPRLSQLHGASDWRYSRGALGAHYSGRPKPCRERPWQPRCQREVEPPAPTTPERLPQGCRSTDAYPTVRDRVRCVIVQNGLGDYWWTFDCIAWRESRYTPWAISPTSDYGVFQVNAPTWLWGWPDLDGKYGDPLNEVNNTMMAIFIFRYAHGFGPWGGGC